MSVQTPTPTAKIAADILMDWTPASATSGVVKGVGAGNSQLVFTVGSGGAVAIQVDANGDGVFEKTISSTVGELGAL